MGSPHLGQGSPGSHAPGMWPQLRQIEVSMSSPIMIGHWG